jgi:thioredoxin 1
LRSLLRCLDRATEALGAGPDGPEEDDVAAVADVTDQTFDAEVLKSKVPVLVDFWAEWCAPCKALSPVIKSLADQYGDRVKIVKMNIDENHVTPGKYQVRSIPLVIAVKDGVVVDQILGMRRDKTPYEDMVKKLL